MLSGAVAGAVFTSPPPSSILAAIRKVGKHNPGKFDNSDDSGCSSMSSQKWVQ